MGAQVKASRIYSKGLYRGVHFNEILDFNDVWYDRNSGRWYNTNAPGNQARHNPDGTYLRRIPNVYSLYEFFNCPIYENLFA
jgi:hypothetical protein